MAGTLISFNPNHLNNTLTLPGSTESKLGIVTLDQGDFIRFIDRNGLVYVAPRRNVMSSIVGTNIMYRVMGNFFLIPVVNSVNTSLDSYYLQRFLGMKELHQ